MYGAVDEGGNRFAIKVLTATTTDKRRRFKNEISFLLTNKHPNIVSVTDHGLSELGPFYVMHRYDGSLREFLKLQSSNEDRLTVFSRVLDGVEAAHLLGTSHLDLKPENILYSNATKSPAVADFGIASFTGDLLLTLVRTDDRQRLANFVYAAPEQRVPGTRVDGRADIYALGLMLNEMFTGHIALGSEYATVAATAPEFAFLDQVVAKAIRQDQNQRYRSIEELKSDIAHQRREFISFQKLTRITETVVPEGEIDDPLAFVPPKITQIDWENGVLTLKLDQAVHAKWTRALHNIGNYTSVMGIPPTAFQFSGDTARVNMQASDVQRVIDFFKQWLPSASQTLRLELEREYAEQRRQAERALAVRKSQEEARLNVLRNVKF